ncbi:MAG: kelch repeat-containing protein, partial [Gammaproteobacteria bacterium]
AYDEARGVIVVLGGQRGLYDYLSDTWTWDGSTWTRGPDLPAPRSGHSAAYDSNRGVIVTFGGHFDGETLELTTVPGDCDCDRQVDLAVAGDRPAEPVGGAGILQEALGIKAAAVERSHPLSRRSLADQNGHVFAAAVIAGLRRGKREQRDGRHAGILGLAQAARDVALRRNGLGRSGQTHGHERCDERAEFPHENILQADFAGSGFPLS